MFNAQKRSGSREDVWSLVNGLGDFTFDGPICWWMIKWKARGGMPFGARCQICSGNI